MAIRSESMSRSQAAAQQSQPEFEALFEQYWARLHAMLVRLLGDPAEAEDLALHTFWQLHEKPPQRIENLGGWLFSTASNLGLNALRARRRRLHYETQAGLEALRQEREAGPARQAETNLERAQVRRVLADMPPRSAQLLLLRHSGFSYAELAEALQLKPASVGKLLGRAEQEFERRYRAQTGDYAGGEHGSSR